MDRGPAFFMFAVVFTTIAVTAMLLRPYIGETGASLIIWTTIAGGITWLVRRRKG